MKTQNLMKIENRIGSYYDSQRCIPFYAMRRRKGLLEVQIIELGSLVWVRVINDNYLTIHGVEIRS
jgi:hypothetical protein